MGKQVGHVLRKSPRLYTPLTPPKKLGSDKHGSRKGGHTGSNKTGVKCSTILFMRFRQRSTSVGVRAIVFVFDSWAVSELGSKSVVVTRL